MKKDIKQHDITGKASNQDKINILGGTEENMYEKKSHGWYKHKDFILLDLICLFLAFLLAHFIRVHSYINLIDNGIYRNALLFILCADLIVLMLFESYTGVLRRGYYRELNIMVKQIIMIELAAGLYLFTVDDSRNFSRAVLYLTGIFYKHVPLMEHNCVEAIYNNVFGTQNLVELCEEYGAERFMMVSTDKAVNPTNVMGATKRMCEMIVQSASTHGKVKYSATRFGNVLGSAGSVIPLFKRQIANGGPVTVTNKRIIRYFMTIPEASQLVLQSGAIANNGELFVLDMGQPVKIMDLAENMIRLSGV